jgi:hypothetical protein
MIRSNNSKTKLALVVLMFTAAWSGAVLAEPPVAKTKTRGALTPNNVLVPTTARAATLPASPLAPATPPAVPAQSRATLLAQVAVAKAELAKTAPSPPPPAATPASFEIRPSALLSPEQGEAPVGVLIAPKSVTPWIAEFRSTTEPLAGLFVDRLRAGAYLVDCAVPEGSRPNAGTPFTVSSYSGGTSAVNTITPTNGRLFFATIISDTWGAVLIQRTGGWDFSSCKFDPV